MLAVCPQWFWHILTSFWVFPQCVLRYVFKNLPGWSSEPTLPTTASTASSKATEEAPPSTPTLPVGEYLGWESRGGFGNRDLEFQTIKPKHQSVGDTVDGRNPANRLINSLSQGFLHPRWCRISSINSIKAHNHNLSIMIQAKASGEKAYIEWSATGFGALIHPFQSEFPDLVMFGHPTNHFLEQSFWDCHHPWLKCATPAGILAGAMAKISIGGGFGRHRWHYHDVVSSQEGILLLEWFCGMTVSLPL